MRLLQRNFEVETRYGGGFVQEIEGVAGGREGGRRVDWFYYVNGIEADEGAAERKRRRRRPHLVGPPRLGRRACACPPSSARSPSRSCPAARASGSRCGSCAPSADERRATRSRRGSRDAGVNGIGALGARAVARGREVLRVLVGPWAQRARATRRRASSSAGPARVRRLRAARRGRRPDRRCSTTTGAPVRTLGAAAAGLVAATRIDDAAADLGRHRRPTTPASRRPPRRCAEERARATASRSPSSEGRGGCRCRVRGRRRA